MTDPGPAMQEIPAAPQPPRRGFGDHLTARVQRRRSQLVLGLDPDPNRLWPRALELANGRGRPAASAAERAATAVAIHCRLAIEAAGEQCVAVKLQLACFERLGAPGWTSLRDVAGSAREHELLVIADAKRGDIDVSAQAYAQAFVGATPTPYGPAPGLEADALTVNPLLGGDAIAPFVAAARSAGAAIFVLVRTSNPGAADLQDLELASGELLSDRIAALVRELGRDGVGAAGLSDVGAVVGATAPGRLEALRAEMPTAVLLLAGVGPQGGRVEDLAPAFAPSRAAALLTASRAIIGGESDGSDPSAAARDRAARLRELAWAVSG